MSRRPSEPCFFVSNHLLLISTITVLAALIPGSFPSPKAVTVGDLGPDSSAGCKLPADRLVDRRPGAARNQTQPDRTAGLGDGELPLILFPERNPRVDGNRVLRFKSVLFAAAEVGPEDGGDCGPGRSRSACARPSTAHPDRPAGLRPAYCLGYANMELGCPILCRWSGWGGSGWWWNSMPPVEPADLRLAQGPGTALQDAVWDGYERALSGRGSFPTGRPRRRTMALAPPACQRVGRPGGRARAR